MKPTTLTFVFDEHNNILLGCKKRGFGAGKYNGFGGKIDDGEGFRACAIRELQEESGIMGKVKDLEPVALLEFRFPYNESLTHIGYVYLLRNFKGEPQETDEMKPCWLAEEDIPYELMWDGDRQWVPMLLQGKKLKGVIEFGEDNSSVVCLNLIEVESIFESDLLEDVYAWLGAKPKGLDWTKKLLDWYDLNKRELPWRDCGDPYKVWVSEIMAQQTRIEAMKPYYENWMQLFPTMADLAAADEESVVHAWQGLGYYSRARNLRLGVQEVMANYGGQVPRDRKSVESLKGVGSYTAGAILSMAFGEREAAVDGNVLRVYSRLYHISDDILSTMGKKKITALVEATLPERAGAFNQALMDFGSAICIPKSPRCEQCPLQQDCTAYANGRTADLPVRIKKTKVQEQELYVGILRWKEYYLLHKRPDRGLLRSMWEFPTVEGVSDISEGVNALTDVMATMGFTLHMDSFCIKELTHVFSHRKWHMKAYWGELICDEGTPNLNGDWMLIKRQNFADYVWAGPHGKLTELCK